jgi:hypothetical protein
MDKYIITDFGKKLKSECGTIELNQYAAWEVKSDITKRVVETSDDLNYLMDKYNTNKVVKMKIN